MEKHVTLVAVFKICFGILGLLLTFIAMAVVFGTGILAREFRYEVLCCAPEGLAAFLLCVVPVIILFFVLISALKVIGGFGLLKHRPWARILVLILACLELIDIPVGTAIGIYSIWVLLQSETVKIFESTD